jgi:hypothetical protein
MATIDIPEPLSWPVLALVVTPLCSIVRGAFAVVTERSSHAIAGLRREGLDEHELLLNPHPAVTGMGQGTTRIRVFGCHPTHERQFAA